MPFYESQKPIKEDHELPAHLLRLRNQERVELIMSFYRGLKEFREMAGTSNSGTRRITFKDIDHLIEEHLRPVKDTVHRLFRESQRGPCDGLLQVMFDMYFGILFHILLKAKENVRLQENYNLSRMEDLMHQIGRTEEGRTLPSGMTELFDRLTVEFDRDSEELQGELERADFMFSQLEKVFNQVIQVYRDNTTIIRSLHAQTDFFAELFPRTGVERLFNQIYPENGAVEAYFLLGFDYLRSGHKQEAQTAFAQAMRSAREMRLSADRLYSLYRDYRDRTLEALDDGDQALALQQRLREIESDVPLKSLLVNRKTPAPAESMEEARR